MFSLLSNFMIPIMSGSPRQNCTEKFNSEVSVVKISCTSDLAVAIVDDQSLTSTLNFLKRFLRRPNVIKRLTSIYHSKWAIHFS